MSGQKFFTLWIMAVICVFASIMAILNGEVFHSIELFSLAVLLAGQLKADGKSYTKSSCPHGYQDWDDCPVCSH